MAIEDIRYKELTDAVEAFVATGRHQFVQTRLVGLACDILRHCGYEVMTTPVDTKPTT